MYGSKTHSGIRTWGLKGLKTWEISLYFSTNNLRTPHTGVTSLVKFPELPKIILSILGPNYVSTERIYSRGNENRIFLHFETIFLVLAWFKVAASEKSLRALIWGYLISNCFVDCNMHLDMFLFAIFHWDRLKIIPNFENWLNINVTLLWKMHIFGLQKMTNLEPLHLPLQLFPANTSKKVIIGSKMYNV